MYPLRDSQVDEVEHGFNSNSLAITSQNSRFGWFMVVMVEAERALRSKTTCLETRPIRSETLFEGPATMDPGQAKRDGDLLGPPGGSREDDRGGRGLVPTHFF